MLTFRLKSMLGLDNFDREDASPDPEEDELEDSQEAQNRRRRYRKGALGDWESVGWTAANHTRRVPGVEFMSVNRKLLLSPLTQ